MAKKLTYEELEQKVKDLEAKVDKRQAVRTRKHTDLHRRVEEFISKYPSAIKKMPPRDVRNLVEDLQIHKTELENQKEELLRAQSEFQETWEKYSDLYDYAPVGYFSVDNKGVILAVNLSGATMLGMERSLLKGRPFSGFIAKDDQDIFYLHRQKLVETKTKQTCELRLVKKDGAQFYAHLECIVMLDEEGKFKQIRAAVSDISERKQDEQALQESKDNLDKAQETAHVGSWSRDLKTGQGHWSDEMYRTLGLVPGSPEHPTHEDFLSRVHPDDREYTDSEMKKAIEKKGAFDLEFRTVPIKGSERVIHSRGEVECDDAGVPVRRFGINQDITETKRLQAQLQEAQKMEAIATLAGGIAHQFNNALSVITGCIELLETGLPEDKTVRKYFERLKNCAHRMGQLTDQLLAYARGGKYRAKTVSLSNFLGDTLPLIMHTISPSVHVDTNLPIEILNIKADLTQIQMVVSAALKNASEAIEGEGHIQISTRNEEIDEEFIKSHRELKPGAYVCLTIEDDGKGMDDEARKRIFEPFFTTKFQGRGLGMAAAYGIVKNHDGCISVYSELGKGTTVRIYLPAIEAGVKEPRKSEIDLPKNTGTVLVIEDEEAVMEADRALLEKLGYRVLGAKTGKEAISIVETFEGDIDLAILNVFLPDMEGKVVYPLLMEARADLKVIVYSGYSLEGPAQEILDAGAQGFIQKPFSMTTQSEKLKEVLEGK